MGQSLGQANGTKEAGLRSARRPEATMARMVPLLPSMGALAYLQSDALARWDQSSPCPVPQTLKGMGFAASWRALLSGPFGWPCGETLLKAALKPARSAFLAFVAASL